MRKVLQVVGRVTWWSFLALLLAGLYFFFFKNSPQPIRFDLLRVPTGAPPAQPGFPTFYAAGLLWELGLVDMIDFHNVSIPPGVVVKNDVEYGSVPSSPTQHATPQDATANTATVETTASRSGIIPGPLGGRKLLLDMYSPEKLDHPVPCLIFIHGGGWAAGNKKDYAYYAVRFAQRGYVVASIGYRFVQEARFPACIEDAKCAVRFLRSHAAEYNIDPEKIAAIGGSAGGHLSLMLGLTPDKPELEGQGGWPGVSSKVAAVVDLYGPTDCTVPTARVHPILTRAIGKSYEQAPELYALASPLEHVTSNAPPILIFQGNIDDLVPVTQSDALAEKLKALGLPYWYDCLYGMPHTMDLMLRTNEHCQYIMNAFFEKYLKGIPVVMLEGSAR